MWYTIFHAKKIFLEVNMKIGKALAALALSLALLAACGGNGNMPAPVHQNAAMFPFEFEAEDLYGNIVTHESFGERELFLLYFWTTWCRVCVIAMPGMAELATEFYDRIGFVSLLGDFESGREAAILMTENANAPFFSVDIMLEDFEPLIPFIDSGFVPTTALIDTQGNMIGDMVMGSDIDGLRDKINAALGN